MTSSRDIYHAMDRGEETSHYATLKMSRRITSSDWYQDVRHMEFELDSDVEYVLILLYLAESQTRNLIIPVFLSRDIGQEMSQSSIPRHPRKMWTN